MNSATKQSSSGRYVAEINYVIWHLCDVWRNLYLPTAAGKHWWSSHTRAYGGLYFILQLYFCIAQIAIIKNQSENGLLDVRQKALKIIFLVKIEQLEWMQELNTRSGTTRAPFLSNYTFLHSNRELSLFSRSHES